MDYYKKSADEVLTDLDSSKQGISSFEAKKRFLKNGPNDLAKKKKFQILKKIVEQFGDILILLLVASAIISFAIGHIFDAAIILVVVIFNSLFGFIQEYRAEKSIEALKKLTSLKAVVIRSGEKIFISANEVVIGDVIFLEAGSKVPADARIIESENLEVDESTLTGESVPVKKHSAVILSDCALAQQKNMIFSSTTITKGHCKAIVVATGMHTQIGKIAKEIQTLKEEKTPLQNRLVKLSKIVGVAVLLIGAVIFLFNLRVHGYALAFIYSISLIVAAIPEGLPAVVTITFAIGVKAMIKKNTLIRKLSSIETLGSVDIICTDKTGTLTKNQMTVKKIFASNAIIDVTGNGYLPQGDFLIDGKKIDRNGEKKIERILRCGVLCNNSELTYDESWQVFGDPTEGALLVCAKKANLHYEQLSKEHILVTEVAFDSSKKYMIQVRQERANNKTKKVVYAKGAPEEIIKLCSFIEIDGKIRKITKKDILQILEKNALFSANALRVLGFAYKEQRPSEDKNVPYEKNLIFLGLQAMIDPPREDIRDSIELCKSAGITTVMITGDNEKTAQAIAKQIGIEGKAMTGMKLDELSQPALESIVQNYGIFARVTPEHKLRIVLALQKKGHVVAMTGDGVNDAPALKKANVGVALGSGTDVAKEASHMIITDNNFSDIVLAIEEGRGIFENISKFLSYMLACHLAEIFVIFMSVILAMPLPLTAIQLLWLNIITDGLPSIALSVDERAQDIMKRKPKSARDPIVSKNIILFVFIFAVLMAAVSFVVMNFGLLANMYKMQTMMFTFFVIFEMTLLFMIRHEFKSGFFSNRYIFYAVFTSILLQLVLIYSPLNVFFNLVPLKAADWLVIFAANFCMLFLFFGIKRFALNKFFVK